MTVFPTGYSDKGSADNTDKVWASDGVTNFNITVGEIGDENFNNKSTSDLSEGTNEYYTEAKVTANSTVVGKADKTNVIEKDSVAAYTPTLGTHPANKDYVDNFNIPDATESVKGKARLSTSGEATTGTDDLTIITPKKAKDNYGTVIAGTDNTYITSDAEKITTAGTLTVAKQFTVEQAGQYTIVFDLKGSDGLNTAEAIIYINDVSVGILRLSTGSYITYSEDFLVLKTDKVQIYARSIGSTDSVVRNFQMKYNLSAGVIDGIVDIN